MRGFVTSDLSYEKCYRELLTLKRDRETNGWEEKSKDRKFHDKSNYINLGYPGSVSMDYKPFVVLVFLMILRINCINVYRDKQHNKTQNTASEIQNADVEGV